MKIALIGYGRMGRLIHEVCNQRGHSVVTIDSQNAEAEYSRLCSEALDGVDVCIDFTAPSAVSANVRFLAEQGKNIVMGTTGWYDRMDEISAIVAQHNIGFLYGSNFSIGVNLFFRIVRHAAALVNRFDAYDACGLEFHHRKKADSPSGTAHTLAGILLNELSRKERAVFDIVDRPIEAGELHFASVRCGSIPGTHEVVFDSEADTISLRHTVRNRQGLAFGAVMAAEWLLGKEGFFTLDDLMKELL